MSKESVNRSWRCAALAKLVGYIIFLAAVGASSALAEKADFSWVNQLGLDGANDFAVAVVADGTGNFYVTGTFDFFVDFGTTNLTAAGTTDAFVAKFNSAGVCVWAQQANAVDSAEPLGGVALDPAGQCYYAATISDFTAALVSVVVGKLDPATGTNIWTQTFTVDSNNNDASASGIAVDSSSNCFVVGSFNGGLDFGSFGVTNDAVYDAFVVKLDGNGNPLWAWQANATGGSAEANGVAADGAGNCFIAGDFVGTITVGSSNLTVGSSGDAFVAKFDPTGANVWAWQSGTTGQAIGWGVAVDHATNCIVAGEFNGTFAFGNQTLTRTSTNIYDDAFAVKFDATGNQQWGWQSGDSDPIANAGYCITTDGSNNCYVAGGPSFISVNFTPDNDPPAWIAKLNQAGSQQWKLQSSMAANGPDAIFYGIAQINSTNLIAVGELDGGPVSFGPTNVTSIGSSDALIVNIAVDTHDQQPLTAKKLQMKVNFAKAGSDSASFSGTFTATNAAFTAKGQSVLLNVGGAEAIFSLDSKGHGKSPTGTLSVTNKKNGSVWTVTAKLKKGNWGPVWAADGLVNHDVLKPGVAVTVPVSVIIGNDEFLATKSLTYTARAGKSGSAK